MATSNFATSLALTLKFEGGFSNHPLDPGGATNMGITAAVLATWRGQDVTADDVRAMSRSEAAAIYRRCYWELCACDEMPAGVDLALFDYAVNSGVRRAVSALQNVIGMPVDGIVGARTLAAAQRIEPDTLIRLLCRQRLGFLRRLKIFAVFGRGWQRRVAAIETRALALARANRSGPLAVSSPTSAKEKSIVILTKTILESRTVWSNIIGMGAIAASLFGFDLAATEQTGMVDAALKIVAGFSFIASTLFRIGATKAIG